jgi:hypothetical protein
MVKRGNYVYSGVKLAPEMDLRIGAVCEKFRLPKSEIFRRSIDYALPAFERASRLPALRTVAAEPKKQAE